jgi:hypothetical protein
MEVWRDGVRYSEGIFGVAVAVDPGKHVIEVRAPGYRSFRTEVELSARGDRKIVAVPPLARIGTDEAPFGADRRAGTAQAGAARPARKLSTLFDAAAITTTAGAAGLAVGTILGLSAARDVRTAQSNALLCGNAGRCTAEGYALIERADDKAIGSTVAFAVGGVAVAAGIGMFVIDAVWGDDDEPASSAVMPMIGPAGGGVRVRF